MVTTFLGMTSTRIRPIVMLASMLPPSVALVLYEIYNISMHTEIEAQFLDINKDDLRRKLQQLGGKLIQPEILMSRTIFDTGPHQFARVRNEGNKITMTYKNVLDSSSITGTKEINLEIDNYNAGVEFLKSCGLPIKAHQETLREIWHYRNSELCIDTWPWIPAFLEIESPTPEEVWQVANELGLSRNNASSGSVDTIYQHYYGIEPDVLNMHTPMITFECQPPEWVKPEMLP